MENLNADQIRYKMSEKQIKTALECLSKPNSSPADREKCYFMWKEPSCLSCYHEVAQNALALITSQEQRIKELGEENVSKWIPIESNEKPQHLKNYFIAYVFGDSDMHFYGEAKYHAYGGNGIVDGAHFSNEGVDDMRVTHWMPIPKLP